MDQEVADQQARDQLLATQRELIGIITTFSEEITSTAENDWTLGLARVRLEMLEGYWMDFQSNHLGLISSNEDNNYDRAPIYATTERNFIRGKTVIYDVQARLLQAGNAQSTDGADRTERLAFAHSQSRLPRINIPEFSGQREEWESFRDLFRALIHNDASLGDVERLYYLKTLVKGDAQQALESLQLTDHNYAIAWSLLEERFEHRRLLVYNHLTALRSLKPAREESAKALQTLIDTLRRHRDQLRALDRPVDQWDDWFASVAAAAMDPITRRAWEDELEKLDAARPGNTASKPGHELASFDALSKFLNSRCRTAAACSSSAAAAAPTRPAAGNARNLRAYVTRFTPSSCAQGQANHYIGHCDAFLKLSPQDKEDKVEMPEIRTRFSGIPFSNDLPEVPGFTPYTST